MPDEQTSGGPGLGKSIKLGLGLIAIGLVGELVFCSVYFGLAQIENALIPYLIGFGLAWVMAPIMISVIVIKQLQKLGKDEEEVEVVEPVHKVGWFIDVRRLAPDYVMMVAFACLAVTAGLGAIVVSYYSVVPEQSMDLFFMLSIPLAGLAALAPALIWIMMAHGFKSTRPMKNWVIIAALGWGMFSTMPSLFFNTIYGSFLSAVFGLDLSAILSAPVVEEFFKAFGIVLFLAYVKDESDGAILGICFGAGFNIIESLIYAYNLFLDLSASYLAFQLSLRALTITVHLFGPMVIGIAVGFIKNTLPKMLNKKYGYRAGSSYHLVISIILLSVAYGAAMFFHGLWNTMASLGGLISFLACFGLGAQGIFGLGIIGIILMIAGLIAHKTSKKEEAST